MTEEETRPCVKDTFSYDKIIKKLQFALYPLLIRGFQPVTILRFYRRIE